MLGVILLKPLPGPWRVQRRLVDHSQIWINDGGIGPMVYEQTKGHQDDNDRDAKQDTDAPGSGKPLRFRGVVARNERQDGAPAVRFDECVTQV